MTNTPALAPSIQPDQLREQILAADPEPPLCTLKPQDHTDLLNYRNTCKECRTYARWIRRINRSLTEAGLTPIPEVDDPEPHCRHAHTNPRKTSVDCDDCKAVVAWRARENRRQVRAGIPRRFTDIPRLIVHVQALEDAGMVIPDIARAANVSEELLQRLRRKKYANREHAERILALPIPERRYTLVPNALGHLRRRVDATGTHRRLRCAQGLGHNLIHQANLLGWPVRTVRSWLAKPTVTTDVADAVKALYPRLEAEPGTCAVSKGVAAAKGWPQARHFSDTNIDDPTYNPFRIVDNPYGVYRRLRALAFVGQGPAQVGARIGEAPEMVELWMEGGPAPAYAHHLVAADYERWCFTEGPDQEAADRARHADWASALAWDDVDIDGPSARPRHDLPANAARNPLALSSVVNDALDGRTPAAELLYPERVQVVTILHKRGWSDRRIAAWTRWNTDGDLDKGERAVCKFRERAGIEGYGIALIGSTAYEAQNGLVVVPAA